MATDVDQSRFIHHNNIVNIQSKTKRTDMLDKHQPTLKFLQKIQSIQKFNPLKDSIH